MSSLLAIRGQVNRRSGHYLTDEALNDLINEALGQLSLEARWPWLDATATITWPDDDTETTTMPFSWQVVKSVTAAGRDEYLPVAQRDIETRSAISTEFVRGFAIHGNTITLSPAPAAGTAVRILGTRHEGTLVNDVDEPFLPDEHTSTLVHYATALVFDRHHDAARRKVHMDTYDAQVQRMKRSVRDRAQGPRTPRVRPGGGL